MAKDRHLEKVDHSILRYANVWEDADLLLEALNVEPTHKVLSIASAGDNTFALAAHGPELAVAVDLNVVQLYLVELKMLAISKLSREEYLAFFGFNSSAKRLEVYRRLRSDLKRETRAFWDLKEQNVQNGLIHEGKFERYLRLFSRRILPLIHSKQKTAALFMPKDDQNQSQFYHSQWDTWRWRSLFRIFFHKRVMGILGRDPSFLKQVDSRVGSSILRKAGEHLASVEAQTNPILKYCLTGNFGEQLPFYVRKENYDKVKDNLEVIALEKGYAQDVSVKYGQFHRFNLSNIFEYMPLDVFEFTGQALIESAMPDAKFAYWNLLVDRQLSESLHGVENVGNPYEWMKKDKGFFYKRFILDRLNR